jgi:xylan 1,4-beta-xylosidase
MGKSADDAVIDFSCALEAASLPLPHFWEHTVGSCHATLALRADWQAQLRRAHRELGFRHVRFHGLLDDDMGTLIRHNDQPLYSFFNADQIMDFLLSIGMRPFVELSFMPRLLSSGAQSVFHYRANVTPPRDPGAWAVLIARLVRHWVERYGLEVRQWYFSLERTRSEHVLPAPGALRLYASGQRHQVSGSRPAGSAVGDRPTSGSGEFLRFCDANHLPADFVTTHHYPTDACGQPGDNTEAQLAAGRRSILQQQARAARRQAGERPLYYTEWASSANDRDPLHDESYAASFIVKTVLEAQGLVQGYGYWTFSDIFEESYFPSVPFHGGFGLLTLHGIPKPAYRAFELLHEIGTELLPVTGSHATVDCWVVRGGEAVTVLLTNFALPRHPLAREAVRVRLTGLRKLAAANIRRIDAEHANPSSAGSHGIAGVPQRSAGGTAAGPSVSDRAPSASFRRRTRGHRTGAPPLAVAAVRLSAPR